MRREIGSPKNMRNKVNDEPKILYVLPRKLQTITFHKFGAINHNKRSCKGKREVDRVIPKGGNNKNSKGRKKKKKKITKTNASEVGASSQAPQPTQSS